MENFDNKFGSLIDETLHEHHSFKADKGQEPLRVDRFLMNRIENSTRNKIQQKKFKKKQTKIHQQKISKIRSTKKH